jgi:hypothetical protein
MNLFNGNLHLVPRIDQLVEWGNWWNVKFPENLINIITTPLKLSFNSGWLSGFIDAEGCFNIYIPKNSVFSVSIPSPLSSECQANHRFAASSLSVFISIE